MTIRVLAPDVASRIAAGEVIERPASVVKELIENSLDAGASEVSVQVRGGGVERIRVADDGAGIPSDQVDLAFQRFATSKLETASELESIASLGFRGEALPSIAAVSRVSIVTRAADEDAGTHLDLAGDRVTARERLGAARGTAIVVGRLFEDYPARRKFLRSTATENSRIHTVVGRYALAYPHVRFTLDTGTSSSFATPGSGDAREAFAAVYGLDVARQMLQISRAHGEDDATPFASGMISSPELTRANRNHISFFVNGRWAQNRMLSFALEQAYHGFLMERRFPLAVVSIAIPHEDIDVNVHPAKSEVRFRHDNRVFGALQQAVRETLTAQAPVPAVRSVHGSPAEHAAAPQPRGAAFWPSVPFAPERRAPGAGGMEPEHAELATPRAALPVLRVLGQMQSTYIVAEGPDGMYLIDQHAAHERVVFERVRAEAGSRSPQSQSLLEPATVQLTEDQAELAESHADQIAGLGFVVERFGEAAFLVRAVPALVDSTDPGKVFREVLDTMSEGGGFETWEERAAYSLACHVAIRAGKTLTHEEMSELSRQLERCEQPNTCPHGRPTTIHLRASQLEREFGRR